MKYSYILYPIYARFSLSSNMSHSLSFVINGWSYLHKFRKLGREAKLPCLYGIWLKGNFENTSRLKLRTYMQIHIMLRRNPPQRRCTYVWS